MYANSQGIWTQIPGWRAGDIGDEIVLIELTAKRWKALKLTASIIAALGFTLIASQLWFGLYAPLIEGNASAWPKDAEAGLFDGLSGPTGWAGIVILVAALSVGIYARFMAWWRHG
jgi:hypothetical protein